VIGGHGVQYTHIEYDKDRRIRRLSLPALHPSATCYNLSLQHRAKISDIAWNFVLSACGKESFDEEFYVRRATVIRSLAAGQVQASLTQPKSIIARPKRLSRPAAPIGFRYEQSGQYVEPGIMRKSWLHGMELAQAAEESGLHVEQRDCADLPTEEYQVNVNLRQKRFQPRKRSATIAMTRLRKTCTRSQRSTGGTFLSST
jgi:hypothetical protein